MRYYLFYTRVSLSILSVSSLPLLTSLFSLSLLRPSPMHSRLSGRKPLTEHYHSSSAKSLPTASRHFPPALAPLSLLFFQIRGLCPQASLLGFCPRRAYVRLSRCSALLSTSCTQQFSLRNLPHFSLRSSLAAFSLSLA